LEQDNDIIDELCLVDDYDALGFRKNLMPSGFEQHGKPLVHKKPTFFFHEI
jgi:hypothetical protein